jgi:predicted nucleic acid-binding protein
MAFVALVDANVLWSAALRDTLVRAALADLYRPAWSEEILDELLRNLKRQLPDLDPSKLDRTVQLLRDWLPDALVDGYQALIPTMTNHPKDRHVLAAAVHAGAEVIVTFNLRDFPAAACEPYNVEAQHPDEFLRHLWDLEPESMARVLHEQAADLGRPPRTAQDVARILGQSVPTFAAAALGSGLL